MSEAKSNRDYCITNARIWTGDDHHPDARSLLIRHGRVVALDEPPPPDVPTIDAHGAAVTPGLIDAHMHLSTGGQTLTQVDLSTVRSRAQFERAIADRHAALPADQWLIAGGWSNENWREAPDQGSMPHHAWLAAAGDRPVVCYRMDLHAAVVNRAVLDMIDTSGDPPGGRIVRDRAGEPTGLLLEAALWERVNPLIPSPDNESLRESIIAAMRHVNGFGVTAVGSMEYQSTVERALLPLRDNLTLRIAVTLLDRDWPLDTSFADHFANDDHLAVIGFKAFVDGTTGSRTAAMLEPYSDDPGDGETGEPNRGVLVELAQRGVLQDWARFVAERGYSPSIHAIGDRAARLTLDAFEGLDESVGLRIEHAQQVDPADMPRFRGRIASMQPLHKADDGRYLGQLLGDARLAGCFAFRSLRDAGATLAFGSDWPVVSCNPMLGMQAAITGLTTDGVPFLTEQNVDVETALRAYTVDAARAMWLADCGRLAPGCLADLVMYDRDPFGVDWVDDLPRVALTMVGGRVVYDGRATAAAGTGAVH